MPKLIVVQTQLQERGEKLALADRQFVSCVSSSLFVFMILERYNVPPIYTCSFSFLSSIHHRMHSALLRVLYSIGCAGDLLHRSNLPSSFSSKGTYDSTFDRPGFAVPNTEPFTRAAESLAPGIFEPDFSSHPNIVRSLKI
ncbi:MAG: hypothetical protein HY961_03955 [Ignavibacteriae bacterium]|nr:hypothetical protein [Ignavibacteriota bacterium]